MVTVRLDVACVHMWRYDWYYAGTVHYFKTRGLYTFTRTAAKAEFKIWLHIAFIYMLQSLMIVIHTKILYIICLFKSAKVAVNNKQIGT